MKTVLFILLLISFNASFAQYNVLSVRVGLATYNMSQQKKLQADLKRQSGLPLRVVDRFPPYFSFGGSLGIKISQRASAGFFLDYMSTGGRLHYEDYSGSAVMDQLLKCYQVGLFLQHQINKSDTWPLFATSHLSLVFSRENLRSAIALGTESVSESYFFKGKNVGFRPGLSLQRKIRPFVLQTFLGYELNLTGRLMNDDGVALEDYDSDNVTAQWGGLRFGLGIGFVPGSKKE